MKQRGSWYSRQNTGVQVLLALAFIGLSSATVFLVLKAKATDRKILQLNFIAILLGLVFEYRRLAGKWSTVLITALVAYALSFLAFAKGKSQKVYVFGDHLEMWPYYFLLFFVLIAMVIEYTRAVKKITEGITLLLTIAINYWILANNYWNTGFLFTKILIIINGLFSLFAVYNALSYRKLGNGARLTLSLWSSVITLILALDNFFKLYRLRDIEHLPSFSDSLLVFLQFFLLGVSSIYIAQNITMIGAYMPGKGFMQSVRDMNDIHLNRFSQEQVYIADSIIVLIISLTGFGLNYFFQFLPVNLMIWAMITLVPFTLYVIRKRW